MRGHPAWRPLLSELQRLEEGPSPRALATFRALEPAFRGLLRSSFARERIGDALRSLVADPRRRIPSPEVGRWVLESGRWGRLSLVRFGGPDETRAAHLLDSPHHLWLGALGRAPVQLHQYHQRRAAQAEVFDRSASLERPRVLELAHGDTLMVESFRELVDVRSGPALLLELAGPRIHGVRWSYERRGRTPLDAVAATPALKRLESMVGVMGDFGGPPQLAALEALAAHPAHFIRWAAVKACLDLDEARGLELLRAAANDAHPELREAARRGLQVLMRRDEGSGCR